MKGLAIAARVHLDSQQSRKQFSAGFGLTQIGKTVLSDYVGSCDK